MDDTPLPTPQELLNKVMRYRDGNAMMARFDLQAAVDHAPGCANCVHRFGDDLATLQAALDLLG